MNPNLQSEFRRRSRIWGTKEALLQLKHVYGEDTGVELEDTSYQNLINKLDALKEIRYEFDIWLDSFDGNKTDVKYVYNSENGCHSVSLYVDGVYKRRRIYNDFVLKSLQK